MMVIDVFWLCASGFNVDVTMFGYESLTTVKRNGVSAAAVEVIGYWNGDVEWIGDVGSTVGVTVVVFDGVGCDDDIVGEEDGKTLGLVLSESFGMELILYC